MRNLLCILLCLATLTSCSQAPEGKPGTRHLKLSEAVMEQQGKTSKDYDMEFELLHSHFYEALLKDESLTIVLAADDCTYSLGDNSPIHRLEGRLDHMLDGMNETMTLKDFTAALPHQPKEAFSAVDISNGTMYYVAENDQYYAIIRFDSDGDGAYDIHMDVALDEEKMVKPSAHTWLYFEGETN